MRGIAAAVLVFEGLVVFFASLVALDLTDVPETTVWWVGGTGAVVCLALAGLLGHRWAFAAGSVLQLALIGAGAVVPTMFFLGAVFAVLWFLALYLGRHVERLRAAPAADGPCPK